MFQNLSLWINVAIFLAAAGVITYVGYKLANLNERLGQTIGISRGVAGSLLLGSAAAMPALVTSISAAVSGHPNLAFSNALGGIAASVAFMAIADIFYRKQSLLYAAATIANLMQGTLLLSLLGLVLAATVLPPITLWAINPVSYLLVVAYAAGIWFVSRAKSQPRWQPTGGASSSSASGQSARSGKSGKSGQSSQRQKSGQSNQSSQSASSKSSSQRNQSGQSGAGKMWLLFGFYALIMAASGWLIYKTALVIAGDIGISESAAGALFTGISTSLPTFVTVLVVVQKGQVAVGVGDIIGGNAFDVLFVAFADAAYRGGSIYNVVNREQTYFMALGILLTGLQVMGLIFRPKAEVANIGYVSFLILLLYIAAMTLLFFIHFPA